MLSTSPRLCGNFELSAAYYDTIHAGKDYAGEAAVVAHNLRLASGSRAIEFGAGTGGFTRHLANRGVFVAACDPSAEMLRVAIRKAAGDQRIKHVQCGIVDWHDAFAKLDNPPDAPFDAGLCMFAAMSYAAAPRHDSLARCLRSARESLFYNARFIFDAVNAAFCARDLGTHTSHKSFEHEGMTVTRFVRKRFDCHEGVQLIEIDFEADGNRWNEIHVMRAFTPAEVRAAADSSGFAVESQFSGGGDRETVRVESGDYLFTTVLVAK